MKAVSIKYCAVLCFSNPMAASSAYSVVAAFVLAASYITGASSRSVPAPAPSISSKPSVNGIFVLTASSAVFANSTTLVLAGVPTGTEWVKFPPQPAAGALPQARLTSSYLSSKDGHWAGRPQAVLSGMCNGQEANVFLQLDMPLLSSSTNTISFQYTILAANKTDLPATGGTVNAAAMQKLSTDGQMLNVTTPAITPGSTVFYSASLVVDVVGVEQYTTDVAAQTEAGLIHVDLGENNFYYPGYP